MKTDVVIIGGGPAGSASALFLAQKGINSILIEKEAFPRIRVGESLTGECCNLMRQLGLGDELIKYGYPIKYGGKVFSPDGKKSFWVPLTGRSAEKGLFPSSALQVRRSDFDRMLLDAARERGTQVVRGQALEPLTSADGSVHTVRVKNADGEIIEVEASVLIDASGQATFLNNHGITGKKERGRYDKQIAIWSHVKGAIRDTGDERSNTLIFYQQRHHWAWFIPLDEEVVSIGIVVPSDYFKQKKESTRDFFFRELLELNPGLNWRVQHVELAEELQTVSNYSYHIHEYTGRSYLCVGDAHRFIDPVISFGVHVAFHEARKAAEMIEQFLQGAGAHLANPFAEYQDYCERGTDVFQEIIDGFWDYPLAFAYFVHERYVEDFRDMFAGRVYGEKPYAGLQALKSLNARNRTPVPSAQLG